VVVVDEVAQQTTVRERTGKIADLNSINVSHSSAPLQQEGEGGVREDDGLQ
jgi:hypothetical protein